MTTVKILVDNEEIESIDLYNGYHKGHWIESDAVLIVGYADTENYIKLPAQECSICHKPHIKGYGADFCPNCGADMRETCNGCTHPCVMYEPTMKACEKKGR